MNHARFSQDFRSHTDVVISLSFIAPRIDHRMYDKLSKIIAAIEYVIDSENELEVG